MIGTKKVHVAVMSKYPRAGRSKTRLAKDTGHFAAAQWARTNLRRLLRNINGSKRFNLHLAVYPDNAQKAMKQLVGSHIQVMGQGKGDLGLIMWRLLKKFAPEPVIIIGADIPGVRTNDLRKGLDVVRGHDFVFAPAVDGGFWAIASGTGGSHRRIKLKNPLSGIHWSQPDTLSLTIKKLAAQNFCTSCAMTALRDVDTVDDLKAWRKERNFNRRALRRNF